MLILSDHKDWSADAVSRHLAARQARYVWLDPADFPQRTALAATFDGSWRVRLTSDDDLVHLDDVTAVLYRRPGDFQLATGLSRPEQRFARAQARIGLGGVLASLPARWVNHPSSLADAEYKPRQLMLAAAAGLRTPATLITNEAPAVRAFAEQVGDLVVKPLAEPLIYEADTVTTVWTRRLTMTDLADLSGVEVTAHLFQQWVQKAEEVRLTAIGGRFFPVAITAGSDESYIDWRSDYESLSYRLVDCPDHVAQGVSRYLSASGLRYGAFDFVITPQGQWVFLECNAAGQWGWLAEECGLPIAEAIADELIGVGVA